MKLPEVSKSIQLILSDVDGVFSDGGITYDNQGIECKQFHVRDGLGVKLWQRVGHKFGIITGRTSHIVKVRATELGVDVIRQGFEEKLPTAKQVIEEFGLDTSQVCYVGDDLPDLPVIKHVGLGVAVADACEEVQQGADYVLKTGGGRGAIRELVETILKSQNRWADLIKQYGAS